jgi:hypothetical protein
MDKQRDLYLTLELHDCVHWDDRKDLITSLEALISHEGIIPLSKERVTLPGGGLANLVATNMEKWFRENYYLQDTWDDEGFNKLRPKERFVASFRSTLREDWKIDEPMLDAVTFSITASKYEDRYSYILISTTMFGISNYLSDPDRKSLVDEVPQLFSRIALSLSRHLSPSYGLVTHKRNLDTYGHDVLDGKLKYIHWFNLFGSKYVDKFGKRFLLEAPAWKVEELNGATINLQLAPNFLASQSDSEVQEDILRYFIPVGVKEVTWP